ncbi:phosphoesterase family-domain-containing protein [Roridomyces roridus]|uniref:Phosphoesterase family-domain-containing protein n=1 Tax=Roridomyces roridus TaxID=1738132 RepID=A0AAD7BDF6_9AGAR|nr:phosphoesterase family-domain-containing protein [Roridomyces roridus]
MSARTKLLSAILLTSCYVRLAAAAVAQVWAPPSAGPLVQSSNYTSFSNTTLRDTRVVPGRAFDRIIQVWLENTDFATAASTPLFEQIAQEGILFTNFNALTHTSEPNYVAAIGGDFFGMFNDNMYHVPPNITTVVDLLEERGVSWATYQENMPNTGFYGFTFTAPDYATPSEAPYTYYWRKHNGLPIFDAIAQDPERTARIRTFNDFANDVVNGTLPQWIFVTPNIVNDAHDTTIDFAAQWMQYWLVPLLADSRVNGENTLILLTFDENETHAEQNTVFTLALGNAVPSHLKGTTDDTLYTHYSTISTVEANWELMSLGRQDTNPTVSNVFSFVAEKTGHQNVQVPADEVPMFNLTNVASGPLTSNNFVPFAAPNIFARGAGGRGVLLRPGIDLLLTPERMPAPVNLAAINQSTPWQMSPETVSVKQIIPCDGNACP